MKKLLGVILAVVLILLPTTAALAGTDVAVYATPDFIGVSVSPVSYNFSTVAPSSTTNSTTSYFTVTNTASVNITVDIYVTGATWTGGVAWTHSDTCEIGADTAGLKANQEGTWGAGDIIVTHSETYNQIVTNQPAFDDFSFGLGLWAPSSMSDGIEKTNIVRIAAYHA
jgi:hypothetical protein